MAPVMWQVCEAVKGGIETTRGRAVTEQRAYVR